MSAECCLPPEIPQTVRLYCKDFTASGMHMFPVGIQGSELEKDEWIGHNHYVLLVGPFIDSTAVKSIIFQA